MSIDPRTRAAMDRVLEELPDRWRAPGRPPERIEPIVQMFAQLWRRYPDLRFAQLLMSLTPESYGNDPFYLEDDILEARLRERLRHPEG